MGVVVGEDEGSCAGGEYIWWWGGRCYVAGGWLDVFFTSCMSPRIVLWCSGEGVYEVCHECV